MKKSATNPAQLRTLDTDLLAHLRGGASQAGHGLNDDGPPGPAGPPGERAGTPVNRHHRHHHHH